MTIEQTKRALEIAKLYELKESVAILQWDIEDFENDPKGIDKSREEVLVKLLLFGKIKEVEEKYENEKLIRETIDKLENLNDSQQNRLRKYFENSNVQLYKDLSEDIFIVQNFRNKCSQSERDDKVHNIYDCERFKKAIKTLELHQLKPLKIFIDGMECKKCSWAMTWEKRKKNV